MYTLVTLSKATAPVKLAQYSCPLSKLVELVDPGGLSLLAP